METQLIQAFNKQINHEFYSAYLYFAMSTYFDEIMMLGFAKFMKTEARKKLETAQKIYDYLILRDEKLTFPKIEEPSCDWINVSDIFATVISHEEFMLVQIKELYKIAREIDDIPALEFIATLLSDATFDIGKYRKLSFRIKNTNVIPSNIEHLDSEIEKISANI